MSDFEMMGLPVQTRFAPKTAQDYDRRPRSSISNRRRGGAPGGFAHTDWQPPCPKPPVLILLPSPAPLDPAAVERGPGGDPVVLGLSLVQRATLAARRAGYRRTLLLGEEGAWRLRHYHASLTRRR